MAKRYPRQNGVALITALLITATATVAAVAMASRQQLDIRRTANLGNASQAYLFALGVEEWGRQVLIRDRQDNHTDTLGEDWATVLPPLTVEGAVVAGGIEDLQGRYNLNNLVKDGTVSKADLQRFQRLLRALDIDDRLATAVVDWIDPDEDPGFPNGAEDNDYLAQEPAYRTANAAMASPSELLRVKGFTPEIYRTLAPYVFTFPQRTPININTATAPVLMALSADIGRTEAEQLIEARGDKGFASIEAFMKQAALKNQQQAIADISLASSVFLVTARVRYEHSRIQLYSLLSRSADAKTRVVMRAQGDW